MEGVSEFTRHGSGIDTEPNTRRVAFTGFPTVTTGHGSSFHPDG